MNSTPALTWRASESCVTAPSPSSERCLEDVTFRLRESEEPSRTGVFHVQQDQDWEMCRPELFLPVDERALVSDTGVSPESLVIAVVVRDRVLGRFERVAEWPLNGIPRDAWPLPLRRFSWSTQLDVAVLAALSSSPITDVAPNELSKGAVFATRIFKVRPPRQMLDFPIRHVSPAEMEKEGVSPGTALYVRWKGADLDRRPAELIEVWLNRNMEDKFHALSVRRPVSAARYVGLGFTAQVYADVLAPILASNDEPTADDGLLSIAKHLLESKLERTLADLRSDYQEEPAGRSKLLPWCWKLAGTDRAFSQLAF